jgi:uncharacterized protein (TIGR00369 family)
MATLGVTVELVEEGRVKLKLPFNPNFTQQNGYMHAGIITTVVDTACGYASYTQMPETSNVLTVEFKVNFLSPAKGDYFVATGEVIRAGKQLFVAQGTVHAITGEKEKLIAQMQATMICIHSE